MENEEELILHTEKRTGKKAKEKKNKKKKTEQKKIKKAKEKTTKTKKKRQNWKIRCPICFNNINDRPVSSTKCGHVFCTDCLQHSLRVKAVCPTCRRTLRGGNGFHDLFLNHNVIIESVNSDDQFIDDN